MLTAASQARFSKSTIALAIVAAALMAFAILWFVAPSTPPPDLDLSRSKASATGLYTVVIEPEAGSFQQGELHSWLITLTTAAGVPVEDARIAVDGGMPQHRHGLPTSPAVTAYLGSGRYRVQGVKFHMSGWWQLKFAVSSAAGDDTATFNITL